jgi:tRNA threonylcarbamoyladenosine biosynthesis protein TsaB
VGLKQVRVLGIDTATRHASIGLCEDDRILIERTDKAARSHATSTLPLIEQLLADAGLPVGDIDVIAVSAGPGSFTGLRIGLSIAKGLACATGARLVGVSTLEALAGVVQDRSGTLCTLLDARKGEVYTACFEVAAGRVQRRWPDTVTTAEALAARLPAPCLIVGDAEAAYGPFLRERLGGGIEFLPFDEYGPRGGIVARLGAEAARAGHAVDATHLEPLYIRSSEAERAHG